VEADLTVARAELKVSFSMQFRDDRPVFNEYDCPHCKAVGADHTVRKDIPHGWTDSRSHWGEGIPTTRMQCDRCGRWSGPWVSAQIVGGGW